MNQPLFWTSLAYHASGWLRGSNDESLRRLWIDDFVPEDATNTKHGVDFTGRAWVGDGPRSQLPYRFVVSVPQNMLRRNEWGFVIQQLVLDEAQRTLQIQILAEG